MLDFHAVGYECEVRDDVQEREGLCYKRRDRKQERRDGVKR